MTENQKNEYHSRSLLSVKEKFSFFIVNVGNIPIMTLLNNFITYFYIVVVGLDPIAVGTLFLISRVIDGFNDPLMGFVVDHLPKTKLGRFRSYLIIGSIVCSLNYLLLWLGPNLALSGKLVIAYISYMMFGFTFDLMDIPLNSLIPVISDHDRDRNSLSNIKGAGYLAGTILFYIIALPLVHSFPTESQGYNALIILASFVVVVFSIIGTLGIKERIQPQKKEKYRLWQLFQILGTRPNFVLFIETLLDSIGSGISGAVGLFFFKFALGREDLFSLTAISAAFGIIVAIFLFPILIKKPDKKAIKIGTGIVSVVASVICFFIPRDQPNIFLIVAFLLVAPAIGINMLIGYGIQADNMDYIEWKFGYRAEGAVASLNSFIIKAASGIGGALAAYALAFIKFDENLLIQTEETIFGLNVLRFLLPGIISLVALLVWAFGYPLNKQNRKIMMDELIKIHGSTKENNTQNR